MNLVEKKKCPLAKIKLHQFPKKCVRKWSRNVLSILLPLWLWYRIILVLMFWYLFGQIWPKKLSKTRKPKNQRLISDINWSQKSKNIMNECTTQLQSFRSNHKKRTNLIYLCIRFCVHVEITSKRRKRVVL